MSKAEWKPGALAILICKCFPENDGKIVSLVRERGDVINRTTMEYVPAWEVTCPSGFTGIGAHSREIKRTQVVIARKENLRLLPPPDEILEHDSRDRELEKTRG